MWKLKREEILLYIPSHQKNQAKNGGRREKLLKKRERKEKVE